MVFGLGGTQELSLPMMTVLRRFLFDLISNFMFSTHRFSILMTMIGEFYILKVPFNNIPCCEKDIILCFQTRPTMAVQLSVYLMIFGSGLAALNDLAFNLKG